jgi:hypothetical protein
VQNGRCQNREFKSHPSQRLPEEEAAAAAQKDEQEASIEQTISLNERRLDAAVFDALKASGASRVVDLGCGEGKLLRRLQADHRLAEIVGMDASGEYSIWRNLGSSSIGWPGSARADSPPSRFADASRQSDQRIRFSPGLDGRSGVHRSRSLRRHPASLGLPDADAGRVERAI